MSEEEKLALCQEKAAKKLSISERSLYSERKAGRIRCVYVGNKPLYPMEELLRYTRENLVDGTRQPRNAPGQQPLFDDVPIEHLNLK